MALMELPAKTELVELLENQVYQDQLATQV